LHSLADARRFGHSAFALRYAELRRFAAKNSQTVENDREIRAVFRASFRSRLSRAWGMFPASWARKDNSAVSHRSPTMGSFACHGDVTGIEIARYCSP